MVGEVISRRRCGYEYNVIDIFASDLTGFSPTLCVTEIYLLAYLLTFLKTVFLVRILKAS